MLCPAAFRRLCVETPLTAFRLSITTVQPPSGGCVLKHFGRRGRSSRPAQPPSGGCVLKLQGFRLCRFLLGPAAFRRLCVETLCRVNHDLFIHSQPPSGGCVLKHELYQPFAAFDIQPPSGGCVLKQNNATACDIKNLPAAFRRLCVETGRRRPISSSRRTQPPSGGCVLKL